MSLLSSLKLGTKLGAGAFGEVFEASEDVCGKVAVKMIGRYPGETDSQWSTRSDGLLKEGQRLENANHPNVVKVMQIARSPSGDAVHLALEYCDGGCLGGAYSSGPASLIEVRNILVDVCNGLHAIHARGMLHRDIKPSNILLKNGTYKIGDFGLVTDHDVLGYASAQGYIPNLAPEVIKTDRTSSASDIWALGMLVYRLLHGKDFCSTFESTLGDVKAAICGGGFAHRLPWLEHIPDQWRRSIRRALNDVPNKRYRDPIQFAQALQSLTIGIPWKCVWIPGMTTWTRERAGRQVTVVHETVSRQRHRWEAFSTPLGGGRRFTLGGGPTLINESQCLRALRQFFAKAH
jgi:serine/threonine protein kinase